MRIFELQQPESTARIFAVVIGCLMILTFLPAQATSGDLLYPVVGAPPESGALGFLTENELASLHAHGFSWRFVGPPRCATPVGSVTTLALEFQGDPVFEGIVRCHFNLQGRLRRIGIPQVVHSLLRTVVTSRTGMGALVTGDWRVDAHQAREKATIDLMELRREDGESKSIGFSANEIRTVRKIWLIASKERDPGSGSVQLQPAFQIDYSAPNCQQDHRLIYCASQGELLSHQNLSRRFNQIGTGFVFDPNPVVASGNPDLTEADDVDLWRVEVALHNLDGSGHLRGDWAVVSTPAVQAFSSDLSYFFSSRNLHFEEVMSYYHITEAQRYIQSLGFTSLNNRVQSITVHATGFDESWFNPLEKKIYFGDGGVDDAEDADIILHEYGHALFHSAVGGSGTNDLDAINEGFADYFAASRTGDPKIGDWNAYHRSDGCHRNLTDLRQFPVDLTGESHADGLIWGGLLWRLNGRLGSLIGDGLAIQSLYYMTPRSTWEDAARALLAAAADYSETTGNPGITAIVEDALAERGFLPQSGHGVLDTGISATYQSIPVRFAFSGPGGLTNLPVDSLYVAPSGLILLHPAGGPDPDMDPAEYQTRLPALAPILVQGSDWRHDEVALTWSGNLSSLSLELRFLSAGETVRRTNAVFKTDGSIEVSWFGDGFETSFPGLTGWFPGGMETPLSWIDLPTQDEFTSACGEAVAAVLPAGQFNLAGAVWRFEVGENQYQAVMLEQPIPLTSQLDTQLLPYPSPARPGDRVAFRITERGTYQFYVTDINGRHILSETLGLQQPGLYEFTLPDLNQTGSVLLSGAYYLRLVGGGRTVTGKLLILK
jgi:hypothetical protein